MIITDIEQIDSMAEQMFGYTPDFITVDMDDYNRLRSSSSYIYANRIEMPRLITSGIDHFKQAIGEFNPEGVNQILLQICGVSSALEVQHITFKEMSMILNAVEEHFGQRSVIETQTLHLASAIDNEVCKQVNIVWGLCNRTSDQTNGYEVYIIAGYN